MLERALNGLDGSCIMRLNIQYLMGSDGWREFSCVLFQLLELLETLKKKKKVTALTMPMKIEFNQVRSASE